MKQRGAKKSPISVKLTNKNIHKANLMAGDAGDRIDFVLVFKSDLEKDIRACKGVVVIKDLFDQDIMRLTLTHESGIPADGTSEWSGGIQYNQFLAPHQRLLSVDINDISASYEVESIVYADGSRESFA